MINRKNGNASNANHVPEQGRKVDVLLVMVVGGWTVKEGLCERQLYPITSVCTPCDGYYGLAGYTHYPSSSATTISSWRKLSISPEPRTEEISLGSETWNGERGRPQDVVQDFSKPHVATGEGVAVQWLRLADPAQRLWKGWRSITTSE